jgi:hypothetical protein
MSAAAKFTLRFRNESTHEMLGLVAEQLGVSKNQLAEEMLERELHAAALLLERDLAGTLELLRRYRRSEHVQRSIDEVAAAEADASEDDAIRGRVVNPTPVADAYGVADAFALA